MGLSAPEPISPEHVSADFDCGHTTLNDWLKKHALKNESNGASRSFVVCDQKTVKAYYALASGSVEHRQAPKPLSRNMPKPIPVIVLARLAVDHSVQGQGVGKHLLKNALQRAVFVAKDIGVKAILVHALTDEAKRFYQGYSFQASPLNDMTLFLSLQKLKTLFLETGQKIDTE